MCEIKNINGEKIMRTFAKLFLLLVVVFVVSTACIVPFSPRLVRGSGDVIVEERDVSDFEKIQVSGVGRVIITQGSSESLSVETDDNLLEYIETEVNGNTLEIGFSRETSFGVGGGRKVLEPTDGFTFRIGVIDLNSILLSGAAKVEVEKLKTDSLNINLSGAGDIAVEDLNAKDLEVFVSGAGDVEVAGKVEDLRLSLSGFGRFQGFDLDSQDASVTISGAGGADVWVTETLDVTISGAGDVKYYGSPTVTPEISGVGRIQGLGDK
jgi:hypothetical protein